MYIFFPPTANDILFHFIIIIIYFYTLFVFFLFGMQQKRTFLDVVSCSSYRNYNAPARLREEEKCCVRLLFGTLRRLEVRM